MIPEERAFATHLADRLIDLYSERDAALDAGDLIRLHEVQTEITETAARRQKLLASAGSDRS